MTVRARLRWSDWRRKTKWKTWHLLQFARNLNSARRIGARRRDRQRFEIGDDGIDLVGLEMILEARHVRRAVADDLAHYGLLAAERVLREIRAVFGRRGDLQLHVADHAGLIEQIAALQLLGSEGVACRKGLRRGGQNGGSEHQRDHPSIAPHQAFSRL